jgi:light-independent protochlorophyllide reductase subunit B
VPARYSPVFGFEGANVLFDTWVHPLMMGLEEHLLQMFREDFEFHDGAAASHLPASGPANARPADPAPVEAAVPAPEAGEPQWTPDGEKELGKIPFFVRGRARRNTERFAHERGIQRITVETLYDAKAHFSR